MPPQINSNNQPERLDLQPEIPLALRGLLSEDEWSRLTYEQRGLLVDLKSLPSQISNSLPEAVWNTLTDKQKIEVLISYKLLPEGSILNESVQNALKSPEQVDQVDQEPLSQNMLPEIRQTIEINDPIKKEFEEVKERINEIESQEQQFAEEEVPEEQTLDQTVSQQDNSENVTFDIPSVPKFTGYQPSKEFITHVEENVNGDPKKSKTWAANIINKIWLALVQHDE